MWQRKKANVLGMGNMKRASQWGGRFEYEASQGTITFKRKEWHNIDKKALAIGIYDIKHFIKDQFLHKYSSC